MEIRGWGGVVLMVVWTLALPLLFFGEPDLKDAIVHRVMEVR